jgi:hypothetical protein
MGAHLGYGGKVEGDGIRCAFHGWCWGLDGANVDIPYGKRRRTGLAIGTHTIHEADGIIWMWHDELGRPPQWDPPAVSKFIDPSACYDIYPDCADADSLRLVPQMVIENTIDFVHLKWAHGWDAGEPELLGYEFDGHTFLGRMRGYLHTKRGDVTVDVANHAEGIGVILAPMNGIREMLQVTWITPIDHENSMVGMTTFVTRNPDYAADGIHKDNLAKAIVKAQAAEVIGHEHGDRAIWEHQRYIDRAPFRPEEALAFHAMRDWVRQFYPADLAANEALVKNSDAG